MDFDNRSGNRTRRFRDFDWLNLCAIGAAGGLYGLNTWVFKRLTENMLVIGYLNDLLAPVLLLAFSNLVISRIGRRRWLLRSLPRILLLTAGAGLWWEYGAPLYRQTTTDPYDLLVYLAGATVYWVAVNPRWGFTRSTRNGIESTRP